MQPREEEYNIIPFCPILHPTMEEFSNFQNYIEQVENKYSKDHGMVKVVPPKQWKARQQDYAQSLEDKMISDPIEQNPQGKGGIYECVHIMRKSIPIREYRKKAIIFNHFTEGKSIETVENLFWKNISFSPPLYGSDIQMSIFDDGVLWNLRNLDSILAKGLNKTLQGVNTPYVYIGCWKTMFAWHKEDLDLGAINYLHYGKPKFWYCAPRDDGQQLEDIAKSIFSENYNKCHQFLRHKTSVINPYQLVKKSNLKIRLTKMAQKEGEFILVFGGAYHSGFNWGYNIAEAVNYGSFNWLNIFPLYQQCNCNSDNVRLNPKEFIQTLLKNSPDLKNVNAIKRFKQWAISQDEEEKFMFSSDNEYQDMNHNKNKNRNKNIKTRSNKKLKMKSNKTTGVKKMIHKV
ncbi:jumonji domain protein 2b [Ichthyophthirius multifiliis]|uniref:Jumonji domain protein 2b n=1 Tax=Ichthyophthirius multifiliis TaxID=5932 RepID=G0QR56_ICHMU|nr:jumonji domain protein 2b [Ichthyophthirius multifiliis]EGR32296.1 jumonji domain protein 2b [Ichthyophthirius multifiliis]|eukprot:XP_004035782.1 jumonji domain protein 2b [Ichthyophthirius multifiliis]